MQKLTKAQEAAMKVLNDKWQSSYSLGFGRNTLDALERKGLVQRFIGRGSQFAPANNIKYRLKSQYPEGVIQADMRVKIKEGNHISDHGIRFGTIQATTKDTFGGTARTELIVQGDNIEVTITIDTELLAKALEKGGWKRS